MANLHTTFSAALELGVSPQTVRNEFERGALLGFRDAAGRLLFLPADVARLKAEREAKARARASAQQGATPAEAGA